MAANGKNPKTPWGLIIGLELAGVALAWGWHLLTRPPSPTVAALPELPIFVPLFLSVAAIVPVLMGIRQCCGSKPAGEPVRAEVIRVGKMPMQGRCDLSVKYTYAGQTHTPSFNVPAEVAARLSIGDPFDVLVDPANPPQCRPA